MFEIIGQITVGTAIVAGLYFAYKKGLVTAAYDWVRLQFNKPKSKDEEK